MTCRDEVLAAFEALHSTTGEVDFSAGDVLAQMRRAGTGYKDATVRTHVSAHILEDGTLVRSGPGRYRLARHGDRPLPQAASIVESTRIGEDHVKAAVARWLEADGWTVRVQWGRERGIDIDAHRGDERWIIEAKGEGPAGPQQVNYFLNALGEIVQRMNDPDAAYGLALPAHRQYRGLVERLPLLAWRRLKLTVLFVDESGDVSVIAEPPSQ